MSQTLKLRFNEIVLDKLKENFKLSSLDIPDEFSYKKVEKEGKTVEHRASLYGSDKIDKIKFGVFNVEGLVYVRNCSICPKDEYDFPIFGYDCAESKKYLFMLLDLHPLRKDEQYLKRYIDPLKEIQTKYKDIPFVEGARKEVRDWTKEFSSGYALYVRCPKDYEPTIEQALKDYLNFYILCVKEAEPLFDTQLRKQINEYKKRLKDIYREKDPGGGPLRAYFGKEWTDRFMKEFLFA